MPIRVGTRLEQLRELRRRIDVEIEQEQRSAWRDAPGVPDMGNVAQARPIGRISNRTDAHASLARLGVTPATVRTWAYGQGLEPAVRGSLQIEVVQAYVDAHVEQVTE